MGEFFGYLSTLKETKPAPPTEINLAFSRLNLAFTGLNLAFSGLLLAFSGLNLAFSPPGSPQKRLQMRGKACATFFVRSPDPGRPSKKAN